MEKILKIVATSAACLAFFLCGPAVSGEFSVNPIRLEFNPTTKSGVIGIKNEGSTKLGFQVQAMEWTQDAAGNDQYAVTSELIFFPKIMSVEPGEDGIIRVGIRNTVVATEKTYRLFIEELPGPSQTPEARGAQISMLVRFGAPIFVTPMKPQDNLELEGLEFVKGVLTFTAKNTGNRHQVVQGIQLKGSDTRGNEVYSLTLADRYLLTGTTKSYTTTIAADQCAKIASLAIEFRTDKRSVPRKLDITRAMCS